MLDTKTLTFAKETDRFVDVNNAKNNVSMQGCTTLKIASLPAR